MDSYTFQPSLVTQDREYETEIGDEVVTFYFSIEYEPEGFDADGNPLRYHHIITVGPAYSDGDDGNEREIPARRALMLVMARWSDIEEELADEASAAAER